MLSDIFWHTHLDWQYSLTNSRYQVLGVCLLLHSDGSSVKESLEVYKNSRTLKSTIGIMRSFQSMDEKSSSRSATYRQWPDGPDHSSLILVVFFNRILIDDHGMRVLLYGIAIKKLGSGISYGRYQIQLVLSSGYLQPEEPDGPTPRIRYEVIQTIPEPMRSFLRVWLAIFCRKLGSLTFHFNGIYMIWGISAWIGAGC